MINNGLLITIAFLLGVVFQCEKKPYHKHNYFSIPKHKGIPIHTIFLWQRFFIGAKSALGRIFSHLNFSGTNMHTHSYSIFIYIFLSVLAPHTEQSSITTTKAAAEGKKRRLKRAQRRRMKKKIETLRK